MQVKAFHAKVARLIQYHRRLQQAQVDNVDALDFIRYWDTADTLFYLDPPYVLSTRKDRKIYAHEMDDIHHQKLVELLLGIRGKTILSGYDNPIYHRLEASGWYRVEHHTVCHMDGMLRQRTTRTRSQRTEVLWLNYYPTGLI